MHVRACLIYLISDSAQNTEKIMLKEQIFILKMLTNRYRSYESIHESIPTYVV